MPRYYFEQNLSEFDEEENIEEEADDCPSDIDFEDDNCEDNF